MSDPVEEFFAGYSPDVQAISRALRAMLKDRVPQALELLHASQNHVGYTHPASARDTICYICPMKNYVRLGFMYGGYLPDPTHALQGAGKRLRHVKVRTLQAAGDPVLEQLVEAAWAEAEGRTKGTGTTSSRQPHLP